MRSFFRAYDNFSIIRKCIVHFYICKRISCEYYIVIGYDNLPSSTKNLLRGMSNNDTVLFTTCTVIPKTGCFDMAVNLNGLLD